MKDFSVRSRGARTKNCVNTLLAIVASRVIFAAFIAAVENNRQKLSTLKIRVKRRLNIWWHRPPVSFWM